MIRYCQWLFALSLTPLGSGSHLISCLSWWTKPGWLSSKSPSSPPLSQSCQSERSLQLRRGFVGLSRVKGSFSPPPALAPVEDSDEIISLRSHLPTSLSSILVRWSLGRASMYATSKSMGGARPEVAPRTSLIVSSANRRSISWSVSYIFLLPNICDPTA